MINSYTDLIKKLKKSSNKERAKSSAWFFKTGKGQYGEGDIFLGITAPEQRKIAHQFQELSFIDIKRLLKSKIHEHRFVALEILVMRYEKGSDQEKKEVVNFYIKNIDRVNNWDLVDTSASYILGHFLYDKDKKILYKLARSKNIWKKRVAIVSTAYFISQGHYKDTINIAEILLPEKHDLIHKATGWMLREVGKKSIVTELAFLDKYCNIMPRTMLRYAIERFEQNKRAYYLNK
ncbi:MAG: DNA alkylation repair protein [Candidatus Staskawiczbacteria bacterium RIFCSPHIGHO2_02_FULL_34_9]|uniref:DNA alkylation repair protein n=1 Tax=Candidatus Staskawiczbacteria bacterium RIFCSPHIGHO2_02_FULL_34_9 TaxID=1802206 RepID=A0A1G2I412_9BACT|nr:MAG: DNA alkylation repair protein [Candidatus Staskawiczbacteria bacterium RIFCSPHIGHO2_02_FULL_34_9]